MNASRKHIPMADLIAIRRGERMDRVDAMPDDLRAVVHDYGLTVVDAFTQIGVTKPRHIRHLIKTVLAEVSATAGGSSSAQGIRPDRPL